MVSPVNYKSVGALGLCLETNRTHHSNCDRMRRACVRSQVTYANVGRETWCVEEENRPDAGLSLVEMHLMSPIVVWVL